MKLFNYLTNRYKIIMLYDTFVHLPLINVYNLTRKEEYVEFYVNSKTYNLYKSKFKDIEDIIIMDSLKFVKVLILKKHLLMFLFTLIMCTIMITSSLFIREIVFVNPSIYDYDINKTINNNLKTYGIFSKLNVSLNDLNKELRTSYPHFAYIGVSKVGAKLMVETIKENVKNDTLSVDFSKGDVISMYDAYITGVETTQGVLVIQTGQSVKKGELLISGNLNYYNDPNILDNTVKASGVILGKVAIYEVIKVNKIIEEYVYSSDIDYKYDLKIFNKSILKKNEDEFSYQVINDIFTINNIISLSKVTSFKKEKVLTMYNYESAKEYSYSKIIYNFNLGRMHEKESILFIDYIDYIELDDCFEFRYLVGYNRNIGTFKKFD